MDSCILQWLSPLSLLLILYELLVLHYWPAVDRSDVSLPSHHWTNGWQPLKNIVTNGWLTEKPSKNHWSQWLSRYHSINGNGHLKNHWFFAMVVNFLPLCLAEADIKQTNDSFWKIKNIFLQCLEQDVPWFMSTCVLVDFMPCLVSDKSSLMCILSRISFFVKNV